MRQYFIRIGALGEIRAASSLVPLNRARRVVVRSPRGVEIGEVISERRGERVAAGEQLAGGERGMTYRIVRPTTDSDELLAARLARHKREAMESCRERLRQAGSGVTLLEVDQFLDGGTLKMHFLGDADAVAREIARDIAEQYESIVRTHHLSELLQDGCGPECGTTAGCGSSCSGCTGCTV